MRIPALLVGVLLASTVSLVGAGCAKGLQPAGEGEGEHAGEGEGTAAGEGEGTAAGEGEGAAVGEGEGTAAGEGEGSAAGEGEGAAGEGEGEGGGAVACVQNRDCPLGEICPAGTCVSGCTEASDWPAGLQCDTAAGAHGTCVQCVVTADCPNQGETCVNDQCVVACQGNGDCNNATGAPICDTTAHQCVQCLQSRDCNLGEICQQNACVAGCLSNSDCDQAAGDVCDTSSGTPGQCVLGCTSDADCSFGTHCDATAGVCVLGCNNDDTRCPQGDKCVNDKCEIACNNAQTNNCNSGDHCDLAAGVCAPGCASNADCGGFTNRVCDTGTGECVQCLADTDCPSGGGFTTTCDTTVDECRASCNPQQNANCFGTGGFNQGVCKPTDPNDPTKGLCVDCLVDSDCNQGETCDAATNTCVAAAQPTGGLCGVCASDADCGGTNQCIRHQESAQGATEDVCAQDCASNGQCPQGFTCAFVRDVDAQQGVVTGKQCVPSDSAVADGFPTCDAFRDTIAQATCTENAGALCGFDQPGAGDGVCLTPDANTQGVCTLPCNTQADCPAGFACDPVNFPNFPVANACVKL